MKFKSDSCVSRRGEPLNSYDDKGEAASHAAFIRKERGASMIPYLCETCSFWHLSPTDRITESTVCNLCKGASGQSKDLYLTKGAAQRRAGILHRESGVSLNVYECPFGTGWHLTRSQKKL